MGAHFSSKHYRRKLTMISKVAVLCVIATLAQAAPEAQWLGHAPVAYAAPDCAHSTQDLVAKSCHPWPKKSVPKKSLSTKKLNTKKSAKMSYPNIAVIPDMSLDTTFPMPSVTMLPPWLFLLPITLP